MESGVSDRYDRQVWLFGGEGQERIGTTTVAVLGLGGLGSQVCQQLAYLGVLDYIILDNKSVKTDSLNRLVGATKADVGKPKTVVAEQLIKSIQPQASVEVINDPLPNDSAKDKLKRAKVIMGCFDNDLPRLHTTALASENRSIYIDAASDVIEGPPLFYGGRVVVAGQTRGCLHCLGELNQTEIRRHQMTLEQLEVEARSYGVPVESLIGTGPSVVTLNGVVASMATTEAMVVLTGLREGRKLQSYYGHIGQPTVSKDQPSATCYYCDLWLKHD